MTIFIYLSVCCITVQTAASCYILPQFDLNCFVGADDLDVANTLASLSKVVHRRDRRPISGDRRPLSSVNKADHRAVVGQSRFDILV